MSLNGFYKSVVEAAGMVVNGDGSCSLRTGEETSVPFTIQGRRLVLPTQDQLKNPEWEKRIAFHPLHENLVRPESIVLSRYRRTVLSRMNLTLFNLLDWMIKTAASPADQKTLTPQQAEFLACVPQIKPEEETALRNLLKAAFEEDEEGAFVKICLVKGGQSNGRKNTRTANVFFDFYTTILKELSSDTAKPPFKFYGVSFKNKKALQQLLDLLAFVIPNISDPGYYAGGVAEVGGTFFEALMLSIEKLGKVLDDHIETFSNLYPPSTHRFVTGWVTTLHDLDSLKAEMLRIPDLSSTENGVTQVTTAPVATQTAQTVTAPLQPVATTPAAQQPVTSYSPTPVYAETRELQSDEGLTFDQIQARKARAAAATVAAMPVAHNPAMTMYQPNYMQSVQQPYGFMQPAQQMGVPGIPNEWQGAFATIQSQNMLNAGLGMQQGPYAGMVGVQPMMVQAPNAMPYMAGYATNGLTSL